MGADEDTAARRERLRALRAAKELLSTPDGAPAPATDGDQQYDPSSHIPLPHLTR